MPSLRRIRLLVVATLAFVVMILIWSSHERAYRAAGDPRAAPDFYRKTMEAINKPRPPKSGNTGSNGDTAKKAKPAVDVPAPPPRGQTVLDPGTARPDSVATKVDLDGDGDVDADDKAIQQGMSGRLDAAKKEAKEKANQKAPLRPEAPSEVVGVGNAAAGNNDEDSTSAGTSEAGAKMKGGEGAKKEETKEEHEAELELGSILKKSPVIIFSKTYCPFSKKAKALLLEKYAIDPTPFIVELDTHPLGRQLQDLLGEKTGRQTVPNIMVNGVSIGGSDTIEELDSKGQLASKVQQIGETRKVTMKLQS